MARERVSGGSSGTAPCGGLKIAQDVSGTFRTMALSVGKKWSPLVGSSALPLGPSWRRLCRMVDAHTCLNDWLTLRQIRDAGHPGKTDAEPGSKQWDAIANAAAAFGHDWAAVVSRAANIEMVQVPVPLGDLPYPALADVMKRDIATLWRGDLETFSSAGAGHWGSVQAGEAICLEHDDARFVSERL